MANATAAAPVTVQKPQNELVVGAEDRLVVYGAYWLWPPWLPVPLGWLCIPWLCIPWLPLPTGWLWLHPERATLSASPTTLQTTSRAC